GAQVGQVSIVEEDGGEKTGRRIEDQDEAAADRHSLLGVTVEPGRLLDRVEGPPMQVGALDVDLALVGRDVEADDARERRLAMGEGDEGVAHGGVRGRGADELPDLRLKKDADLHRTGVSSREGPASRAGRAAGCSAASRPRAWPPTLRWRACP